MILDGKHIPYDVVDVGSSEKKAVVTFFSLPLLAVLHPFYVHVGFVVMPCIFACHVAQTQLVSKVL